MTGTVSFSLPRVCQGGQGSDFYYGSDLFTKSRMPSD